VARNLSSRAGTLLAVVVTAAVLCVVEPTAPAGAAVVRVAYVVDGDTIRLSSGEYVRLIGMDAPEVGECGYTKAKKQLDRWVGAHVRLVNPASVDNRDQYGRLLRYVQASGRDTGLALIRKGLAKARYDGLDGYDWHPRQKEYRRADRLSPDVC
jgi:endonuclease YncB( thermonuclease family)